MKGVRQIHPKKTPSDSFSSQLLWCCDSFSSLVLWQFSFVQAYQKAFKYPSSELLQESKFSKKVLASL